jgi:hypothetical protein
MQILLLGLEFDLDHEFKSTLTSASYFLFAVGEVIQGNIDSIKTFTLGLINQDNEVLTDTIITMTLGMILGMAVCPIIMRAIRSFRQRLRVNKILREISETQRAA